MPLHLIKMCVGIDTVGQLRAWQARRLAQRRAAGEAEELRHLTRHRPRRAAEILEGGSLYWVIKGYVRVRQPLLRLDPLDPPVETKACAFVLSPALVPTRLQARRPHQGWRYLRAEDAPADLPAGVAAEDDEAPPEEMLVELRALGLL
jgi:hypothetical protein